tara:strand:+ start:1329 stop:1787 length:459 start_codon:yes stop_codon:yes gene_type:complete
MDYRARISVFGGRKISNENYNNAYNLGRLLNKNKYPVYCGDGEGVMEAVAKGIQESGGECIGILKGLSTDEMNSYIDIPIVTNMCITRNALLAYSCDAAVAISGQYGTLSEIAYALQLEKSVIGLGTWEIDGVINASDEEEIIKKLNETFKK